MTSTDAALGSLTPVKLTCEYLTNPIGVEATKPRLSWVLESPGRGQRQTAYQVLVASSEEALAADEGDLWDSGRVQSELSIQIAYGGRELESRLRCYWKVRTWDGKGQAGPYSEAAYWEMGLLTPDDWKAQWISGPIARGPMPGSGTSPILRRAVEFADEVRSARVYVCGLGYYELYVNGQRIGNSVLDPAFTRYDQRALYVTYDVTDHLNRGANAMGVMLGNGWYNCHTPEVWCFEQATWRDVPKLILQLYVELADGTTETILTDSTWKASTGPIVFDGLRNGETYDAREEKPGWTAAEYSDAEWSPVQIVPSPGGVLASQQMPPMEVMQTITPVAIAEPRPGVFVFDLGQNLAGWAQLTGSGPAGTEIKMRYAEKIDEAGDIDPSNIRTLVKGGEFQTDTYILKGDGTEVWEPRFTYHGFQFVQVTGFPGAPSLDNLRGRVVHTSFQKRGKFACSN